MTLRVKICGLTTAEAVKAAEHADFIGFIFYPPSPRNLSVEKAAELAHKALPAKVAVTVDAEDELLAEITEQMKPDYFQLHGEESPERVREIKAHFGLPVIKAIRLASSDDAAHAYAYEECADMLLFDARVPKGLPGGNGLAFDWRILAHRQFSKPWFISGGISSENLDEALRITGAAMVDVSSSLESAPGIKSPELVRDFVKRINGHG